MKITTRTNPTLVSFDSLCPGDVFIIKNNLHTGINNIVGMKINKIVNGQNFIDLSIGYLCYCNPNEIVELKRDAELILD